MSPDPSLSRPPGDAGGPKPDVPGVIAPPPLVYLAGLAMGFGLEALLPSVSLPGVGVWPVGTVLVVAGLALARAFLAAFRRARTPVDPRKPTTTIVTTGPYRLSRNPAYLAMALVYAGIAVLTGTLWAFATLVPTLLVVDRAVIRREERYLFAKFGDEYGRFKAGTRRWI